MDTLPVTTIEDLLAVIHGDGGQYLDEKGMEQAIAAAHTIVTNLRVTLDNLSRTRREWFQIGLRAGRTQAYVTEQDAKPIAGEVETLVAKIQRYEKALKKITDSNLFPERIADEALHGEARAAMGVVRG